MGGARLVTFHQAEPKVEVDLTIHTSKLFQ